MDIGIRRYLDDMESVSIEQFEIVSVIRSLFLDTVPQLNESIKYGGLTYSLSKELVGGIFTYKEHISVEFSNGADFQDLHEVLEGQGKRRRHIKIRKKEDIEGKSVAFYISAVTKSSC